MTLGVHFAEAQEGDVQPAAGIEIELGGGVDHGGGVAGEAEQLAVQQGAAIGPVLHGLVVAVQVAARRHQLGHRVGDAEAVIDDRALDQFLGCAPRDGLARREGLRRLGRHRTEALARHGRVIGNVVGHGLAGIDDHGVDDGARHPHRTGRQAAELDGRAHLDDHLAARIMGCQGDRVDIQVGRFLVQADVALRVGEGAADDGRVDGEGLVTEQLPAVDLDHFHEVFGGPRVQLAALDARVDKGAQADVGKESRPSGADLAVQLHGDAAGQYVGLDLLVAGQFLHARRPDPVAADDPSHHAFVSEAVQALGLAVADSQRVNDEQIPGMAGVQEAFFQCREQTGRLEQPASAADQADRFPIVDPGDGLFRGNELVDGHDGLRPRSRFTQSRGSNSSAPCSSRPRATTMRWISEVPS